MLGHLTFCQAEGFTPVFAAVEPRRPPGFDVADRAAERAPALGFFGQVVGTACFRFRRLWRPSLERALRLGLR